MARAGAVDFSTRSPQEQQALADFKKSYLNPEGKLSSYSAGQNYGGSLYALERGGLTADDFAQTPAVPPTMTGPATPTPAAPSAAGGAAPSMTALSTVAGAATPPANPTEGFGAEMPTPLAVGQGRRTLPPSSYALAQIAGQRGGVY